MPEDKTDLTNEERRAQFAELVIEGLGLDAEAAGRLAGVVFPEAMPTMLGIATPKASMGRIVRYHTAVKSYPAVITAAHPVDDLVDLVIFGSPLGSVGTRLNVRPGGEHKNNTWSWPPLPEPEEPDDETDDEAEGSEAE